MTTLSNRIENDATISSRPGGSQRPLVLMVDAITHIGGAETTLISLLRRLDPERYRQLVVVPGDGPLLRTLREVGIDTAILPMHPLPRTSNPTALTTYPVRLFLSSIQLARLALRVGASLIHTHTTRAHLYGGLAGRLTGIPVLIEHHDFPSDSLARASWAYAFKFLASWIVVNSRFLLDRHLSVLNLVHKLTVVYPPIELASFTPDVCPDRIVEQLHLEGFYPVVGFIGQIIPRKGLVDLVLAAPKIAQVFPKVHFLVVGDEPDSLQGQSYFSRVQDLVKRSGMERHFTFTGFREDIAELAAAMDIYVLASRREIFGKSLVEAMAMEKPVVATRCGGPEGIVDDGRTGILIPPQDPEALSRAIIQLAQDPRSAREMGIRARAAVVKRFTVERYVESISSLYERLIASRAEGERR